jgi:hypothetical protein
VPLNNDGRVTLRIYTLSDVHQAAVVMADRGGTVTPHVVDLNPIDGIAFGTLELAPSALNPRAAPLTLTVSGAKKVWGLATVTDNATQRVTAFWPQ